MAQDGAAAGVAVLDVENRVVARLLHHLDEVEVEGGVVLAGQNDEADEVLDDLLDDLAQGDEGARSLGHLHTLAAALPVHKRADLPVQRAITSGERITPHGTALPLHARI